MCSLNVVIFVLAQAQHTRQEHILIIDTKCKQGGQTITALLSLHKPDISKSAVHEYMLCIVYIFISQKVI